MCLDGSKRFWVVWVAVPGTAAPWRTMTGVLIVESKERLASKVDGVDIVQ